MKRRSARRDHWQRVTRKTFSLEYVERPAFTGHVGRVTLLEVSKPLWVPCAGREVCVVDSGYVWVQYFPEGRNHALTAMFDAGGGLAQWYFDICLHGLDADGVPYWDDLYLDVVGQERGPFELIDVDELEAALAGGAVTQELYESAWREARELMRELETNQYPLLEFALRNSARVPSAS